MELEATKEMDNVVVVTVTYNSNAFLERLVKAVDVQTYKVSRLIIVDNASDSANADKNKNLADRYQYITLLTLAENLGGAGGFEAGMRYVFEHHIPCDWVWLMDDDAYPTAGCLEELLKYRGLENIGCLCPVIFGVDLNKHQMFHHKIASKYLNGDIRIADTYEELKPVSRLDENAFVGPLINANIVDDIGFPDGELFIYGDDTEYTYRISRKYNVYLIKDAIINHRDMVRSNKVDSVASIWKSYYKYRNRIIFVETYKENFVAGVIGKLIIIKNITIEIGSVIKSKRSLSSKFNAVKLLVKSICDGLLSRKGKRVDPQTVSIMLK